MPIKIPRNDMPLATIIEGRWYSVGKNGRPTLELTRTQRRRIQRQYCIFLRNKDSTQVFTKANSIGIEVIQIGIFEQNRQYVNQEKLAEASFLKESSLQQGSS
ncbi:unnamed protein product [Prunus armeniaca]